MNILPKLLLYAQLMRLNRPVGIFLLLWPTLWALWIAGEGHPPPKLVMVFIAGVVLMRSAGCVINDYWDRHWDGKVTRTRLRPLATGKVSALEALILFSILCLFAALLLFALPPLSRWLAIPAVFIAVLYPTMKRYTHLPQLGMGVAFSWGILMAFAAQTGSLSLTAWFLFLIACLWPIAYDTMYAMVDREDDLKVGIKSTAILWGKYDTAVIAGLHATMILLLIAFGLYAGFEKSYYVGLVAATVMMVYLQYLIKDRIPQRCFKAFLTSHWVGCVIFMGLVKSLY